MTSHVLYVGWLADYGYEVVTFDYRGYGKSEGKPSRKGLVADGVAMLNFVAANKRPGCDRIYVLGQSLGGAVAVPAIVQSNTKVSAVILESTFASYRQIARAKLGAFFVSWAFQWPLSYLVSDDLSPLEDIAKIHAPLLVIHGDRDPVVPLEHGQRLYEAASNPKELWEITNGEHTPAFLPETSPSRKRLVEYLRRN